MQISSASLLAAQQARPQTPVHAAQAKPSGTDEFEPLLFATKVDTPAAKPDAAVAQRPANPGPITRPGSQLDIKI